MRIGYVRVSKADGSQATDLQRDAVTEAGVEEDHIYEDTASGKRDDRPGLAACLKALRPGDTLVVWKLDRLGRNLKHLVNTVDDLASRGVGGALRCGRSYVAHPRPAHRKDARALVLFRGGEPAA